MCLLLNLRPVAIITLLSALQIFSTSIQVQRPVPRKPEGRSMANNTLTTASGAPVGDNQNSQTVGHRGPITLQDFWLIEKLAHFDREVIPERRVHAKGSGAFGTLKITHDITKYSKAKVFGTIGKETKAFMRFSTVAGERGAATPNATCAAFRSSSIPKRATGTSSATTRRCSLFATR
jgi:hypothetical protein